jgi:TonB family protein
MQTLFGQEGKFMRRFNSSHLAVALAGFLCITAYSVSLLLHPAQAQASDETPVMDILKEIPADEDEREAHQEWRYFCSPQDAQAARDYFFETAVKTRMILCTNHKAISMPSPEYSRLARAAGVSGKVLVEVLIDENGRVIYSRTIFGHPLLSATVVRDVCQARFIPTLIAGQPVKVSTRMGFNFVPE